MEPALFERGVIRDAGGGAGWEAGWEWAVHAAVDRGGTRCADVVCMHIWGPDDTGRPARGNTTVQ